MHVRVVLVLAFILLSPVGGNTEKSTLSEWRCMWRLSGSVHP